MIYIVDLIGQVVQNMRSNAGYANYYEENYENSDGSPYYMYGHRQEIANRLTEKEQRPQGRKKRYPLIALKLDTSETVRGNVNDFSLNLVIATNSKIDLNAEQRMEETFKPILYPLYQRFIDSFKKSGYFMWDASLDQLYPPHIKIDRPFWGTPSEERNEKNIFNNPVDAIEIVNLKFSVIDNNC